MSIERNNDFERSVAQDDHLAPRGPRRWRRYELPAHFASATWPEQPPRFNSTGEPP